MANSTFLQKVFCDISLEQRPDLWQDAADTEERNVERIEFLGSLPQTEYRAQLDPTKSTTKKNGVLAKALREKGNKSYGAGDNIEAMNHYNQALRFALPDGQGLVLANRSALWAQLGEPRLVEEDVGLALEVGYPAELTYKLLERRARALAALDRREAAEGDVAAAVAALEDCRLEGGKLAAKQTELERLGKEVRAAVAGGEEARAEVQGGGPALPGDNKRFPTFSDAVTIRYEEGRGRFAVAARDIRPGELLAKETAYVSLLDKEWSKSHCWHCLTCTKSPLPCPACSGVQYCSRRCRDQASSSYHKYECLYTDSLYQAQMGAWHLAYRALTMRPWSDYRADLPAFLARDERAGERGEAVYSSQDVASFHSLVSHDGGSKQAPALMMQCHVVVFLLRLLRTTGYTEPGPRLQLAEEEVLAGRLLHHFMRAAYYNTHEITEVEKTGDGWVDNKARRVGRVTNPSLALINHSCDPNYSRVSHGVTTFGFASRPIGKGQEILDTYCKPVAAAPREERHKHLEKYNFTCGCPACRDNWPTLPGMYSDFSGLPPAMYRQPANRVEAAVKRIQRAEEAVHKAERQGGGVGEVAARIAALVEEVHKLVRGPHHAIAYWEGQLHQALLHLHAAKVTSITSGLSVVTWPLTL